MLSTYSQDRIQVLWILKLIQILGSSVRKIIQNYEYKIRYGNEHLFIVKKDHKEIQILKRPTNSTKITKIKKIT